MYLQSVTRFTNNESGTTGYTAIYSNGLDFRNEDFFILDGESVINIPSIVDMVERTEARMDYMNKTV